MISISIDVALALNHLHLITVADPGIGRGGGGGGGHRRGCGKGWGEVVGGAAPGRVREGGTPPAQLGGVGECCKLPHRGLGRSPRSQRFLRRKPPPKVRKNCTKNVITDRGWGATDLELSRYMFNAPMHRR